MLCRWSFSIAVHAGHTGQCDIWTGYIPLLCGPSLPPTATALDCGECGNPCLWLHCILYRIHVSLLLYSIVATTCMQLQGLLRILKLYFFHIILRLYKVVSLNWVCVQIMGQFAVSWLARCRHDKQRDTEKEPLLTVRYHRTYKPLASEEHADEMKVDTKNDAFP